jgi:hypothetical protein
LFLLWPLVLLGWGVAGLMFLIRPAEAQKLRVALLVFNELSGLIIDVDTADGEQVRIRLV